MVENAITKLDTFKSGPFRFSRLYDANYLAPLLIEARVLKETVTDLPILPRLAAKLEVELVRRSIHGTAAIEGNPLSEEEVGRVLSYEHQREGLAREELEIDNLKTAYRVCRVSADAGVGFPVNEKLIKAVHRLITVGIDHPQNEPGAYRNHPVEVGGPATGGIHRPPKALPDVQTLMAAFTEWINQGWEDEPLPVRAALAHYHLGIIHPFSDGNGRTARLVEALILEAQGIKYAPLMLANYYHTHVSEYYWAFSRSLRSPDHQVTPFLEFVLQAFISSLRQMKDQMTGHIRLFALREHLDHLRREKKLTRRQHALLSVLLEQSSRQFTLSDLFAQEPYATLYQAVAERTARRDLQRLQEQRLLTRLERGRYQLNTRALD